MGIVSMNTKQIHPCSTMKLSPFQAFTRLKPLNGRDKDKKAREAIQATGAQIRDLPPYSPDFNPIEMMWSKVKAFLRKAKARTMEELTRAIGLALQTITSKDVIGWLKACGYIII